MDAIALLRTLGALAIVLALLGAGLWALRRFEPAMTRLAALGGAPSSPRRLELVERLGLDPRRALVLVRHDGREHLVLFSGDHATCLASNDVPAAGEGGTPAAPEREAAHA